SPAANSEPTAPQPTTATLTATSLPAMSGAQSLLGKRDFSSTAGSSVRGLPGLDQAVHGLVQGDRNAGALCLAHERAGDEVDPRRAARSDVVEHRGHVRIRAFGRFRLAPADGVDVHLPGILVELDAG